MMIYRMAEELAAGTKVDMLCCCCPRPAALVLALDFVWWWCRRYRTYCITYVLFLDPEFGGGGLLDPKGFRIFGIFFWYQRGFRIFWIQKVSWVLILYPKGFRTFDLSGGHRAPAKLSPRLSGVHPTIARQAGRRTVGNNNYLLWFLTVVNILVLRETNLDNSRCAIIFNACEYS